VEIGVRGKEALGQFNAVLWSVTAIASSTSGRLALGSMSSPRASASRALAKFTPNSTIPMLFVSLGLTSEYSLPANAEKRWLENYRLPDPSLLSGSVMI
jgi:hypothetical protein